MNTAEQISDLNKEIEDLRKEWQIRCSNGKMKSWHSYPETEPETDADYLVAVQGDGVNNYRWLQVAWFKRHGDPKWDGCGYPVYAWRKLPPIPRKKSQAMPLDKPA